MVEQKYKLSELAKLLNGELVGQDVTIQGVAELESADRDQISYVEDKKFYSLVQKSSAGALLLPRTLPPDRPAIVVDNIEPAIVKLLGLFAYPFPKPSPGIHPSAVVESTLPESVAVGANAYIGKNVSIVEGTVIFPNVSIADNVEIGENCIIWYGVVIRERVVIGNRVIIHPNVTIGADGFGYYFLAGRYEKIPHTGMVEIGNDVEIGANTCVDRAKIGRTVIGDGTKIDNLVQIAHNVKIGKNVILVGQVGLAGSVKIDDYAILGGKVGVADHITIGKQAKVAAYAGVSKNVPDGKIYIGIPAIEHTKFLERERSIKKLPTIIEKLKELEDKLDRLQESIDDSKRS